ASLMTARASTSPDADREASPHQRAAVTEEGSPHRRDSVGRAIASQARINTTRLPKRGSGHDVSRLPDSESGLHQHDAVAEEGSGIDGSDLARGWRFH